MHEGVLNGSNESINIDVESIDDWFHLLHLQVQDTSGLWSSTSTKMFVKMPPAQTLPDNNMTGQTYRYWFDDNTADKYTGILSGNNDFINVDVESLSDWYHVLYFQVQNSIGLWSSLSTKMFVKMPPAQTLPDINMTGQAYRYWFDDNTADKHTGILSGNNDIISIDVESLSDWYHVLYFQVQNSAGIWSSLSTKMFVKMPPAQTVSYDNMAGQTYRYWFDDKTEDKHTGILSGNNDIINIDVESLSDWYHLLNFQIQAPNGVWSSTSTKLFAKVPQSPSAPNRDLTGQTYRYWFDEEDNIYEGTLGGNIVNLDIPVDSIEDGDHVLYLQVHDEEGRWSATASSEFSAYSYGLTLLASGEGLIQLDTVSVRKNLANLNLPSGTEVTLHLVPDAGYGVKTILLNESEDITASLLPDSTLTITIDSLTTISTTFDLTDFSKLGDVNNDNLIDVADIAMTVSHLIGGHPQPFVLRQADANNDGDVDVADLTRIVDVITGAVERGKHDAKQRFANEEAETSASVTGSLSGDVISFSNSNPTAFSAFQMTVTLPEGVEATDISLNPSYRANHQLATGRTEDGRIAIIAYSPDNRPLLGGEGPLLQIRTDKVLEGEVSIENIVFASGGKAHRFAPMRLSQADGINDVTAKTVSRSYDLSGRRASSIQMPRGVVIIGGRKIVFK